jgi:hypothetical protein
MHIDFGLFKERTDMLRSGCAATSRLSVAHDWAAVISLAVLCLHLAFSSQNDQCLALGNRDSYSAPRFSEHIFLCAKQELRYGMFKGLSHLDSLSTQSASAIRRKFPRFRHLAFVKQVGHLSNVLSFYVTDAVYLLETSYYYLSLCALVFAFGAFSKLNIYDSISQRIPSYKAIFLDYYICYDKRILIGTA